MTIRLLQQVTTRNQRALPQSLTRDTHTDAPLTWHEHFHHTRTRLAEWVARTGCRPGEHRP